MNNIEDFILSANHCFALEDLTTLQRTVTSLEYDAYKMKASSEPTPREFSPMIDFLKVKAGKTVNTYTAKAQEALLGDDIDAALKLTSMCAQYEDLERILKLV